MEPFEPKLTAAGILYLPGSVVLGENHSLPDQRLARSFPLSATVASGDECLDALAAARRLRAQADALEAHALARLDQVRGKSRYVADEAALELRINRKTAADRIERAKALVRRMPKTLRLMAEGEFEGYTAERIATAAAMLSDGQAREVDERLYAKVRDGKVGVSDPANLVRATRRLVEKVDLPAEIAASAYARIDALARRARNGGDERTLEQLRADIYADLLLGNEPGVAVPSAAAMVYVHVPVNTAEMIRVPQGPSRLASGIRPRRGIQQDHDTLGPDLHQGTNPGHRILGSDASAISRVTARITVVGNPLGDAVVGGQAFAVAPRERYFFARRTRVDHHDPESLQRVGRVGVRAKQQGIREPPLPLLVVLPDRQVVIADPIGLQPVPLRGHLRHPSADQSIRPRLVGARSIL